VEELFGNDVPGAGRWSVGGRAAVDRIAAPALHLTAERDLIAPPQTVASGEAVAIPSGHVGMIVGSARKALHGQLQRFLVSPR
jgi:polyhydroxyalkanoate synthase